MSAPEVNTSYAHLNFYVLSTGEAARELGIDPSTMRRWAYAGRIAYVTDPNGWFLFGMGSVYALRDARREGNQ
ncbi:putative site-specific integrase-resolvase [Lipingzhangella halophila]|uniref:Putative site-specific integrase-resolvase n=1 Tax=Lipingzhangella halophila TaxID=1783352 RepID=A0A7W7RMJ7_9ACTN|nr:helix-turn-helix domain-containing protein [Lipingzhangella halophila]MBB4934760.1 putative site-specific integrase-resolvase [Lipingzhangella halophila]